MPNQRIAMRKIREILRLRFDVGLSFRQISQCADVSTGAIQKMLKRLAGSPVSWPLPEGMSDAQLARLLYPESDSQPGALEDPDWAVVHMELQRKGVTRHLLWEEYCQQMPVRAYSYSQFCCRYQTWCQKQKRSMRQLHIAGEKCFIDYCGPTVAVISPSTGESGRRKSSWPSWARQTTPGLRQRILSRCRTGCSAMSGRWSSSVVCPKYLCRIT